jgi:hypothetical protein
MDERVGWTNLSLFSFATWIHYSIHPPISVKKLCLKEAAIGGWEAGRSRRRKSHGESVVGRWKHDKHGGHGKEKKRWELKWRREHPSFNHRRFPVMRPICELQQKWCMSVHRHHKFQTIILSGLNGLLQWSLYQYDVKISIKGSKIGV